MTSLEDKASPKLTQRRVLSLTSGGTWRDWAEPPPCGAPPSRCFLCSCCSFYREATPPNSSVREALQCRVHGGNKLNFLSESLHHQTQAHTHTHRDAHTQFFLVSSLFMKTRLSPWVRSQSTTCDPHKTPGILEPIVARNSIFCTESATPDKLGGGGSVPSDFVFFETVGGGTVAHRNVPSLLSPWARV